MATEWRDDSPRTKPQTWYATECGPLAVGIYSFDGHEWKMDCPAMRSGLIVLQATTADAAKLEALGLVDQWCASVRAAIRGETEHG